VRIHDYLICSALIVASVVVHGSARADDPITCGWDNGIFDSVPPAISNAAAAWTGEHLFLWGRSGVGPAAGWLYDPSANRWTRTSESGAPEEFSGAFAAWTGSEILLWNISSTRTMLAKYDPTADTWSTGSLSGAPSPRGHASVIWTGAELIVWGGQNGLTLLTDGARYDPVSDTWEAMTSLNAPQGRRFHSAVWTAFGMIVWGGDGEGPYLSDGAVYDPVADTWSPIADTGAPTPRVEHTAVWTGSEMIVWGGDGGFSGLAGDGGRYDPVADEWNSISASGAPTPRDGHEAVWTGSEMVVWGGQDPDGETTHDGARFDPASDIWMPVAPSDAPASGHTATWTDGEMIVYGFSVVGGRYDPALNAWTATFDPGMPPYGFYWDAYVGVWTGTELIVWGTNADGVQGGRYNLELDQWFPMSMAGAPSARHYHTAVWTGNEMIVWGGHTGGVVNTGGRYNPATDSWTPTSVISAPSPRALHSAVWTGTEMIITGGVSSLPGDCPGDTLSSSRAYDPTTDTWRHVPSIGARAGHVAVWTGSEVITWGGHVGGTDDEGFCSFDNVLSAGSRYDPATDVATPISTTDMPQTTSHSTAVWTGAEMIVWGGNYYFVSTNYSTRSRDGGRYVPAADSWVPMATDGGPVRAGHKAVWTGNEMIVWGGEGIDLGVSGIYTPAADRWTPLPTERQPDYFHNGPVVWTGDLMIVWKGHGGRFRVGVSDGDGDGLTCGDNCPAIGNVGQEDADSDGNGDACDNCQLTPNPDQADADLDMVGDVCDNCPLSVNTDQFDDDSDGLGNACDPCFGTGPDADVDAVCDDSDNCPAESNSHQTDADTDGVGNLCDLCPQTTDLLQADLDGDGSGDACDCQPGDASDRSPGTIDSLLIVRTDPTTARLGWAPALGADAYAVHRGLLSALAAGDLGSCVGQIIATTSTDDPETPPLGDGFTYLVQGQSFDCGLGSMGFGLLEHPRVNDNPGACTGIAVSDARATADLSVHGDSPGSYVDTLASDDTFQTITEEETGGNPSSRFSQLEHRWEFAVATGSRSELHVEGHRTPSPDGDDFEFEFSVDGGNVWNAISLGSLPLVDDDHDQVVLLPSAASGSVMIRVIDTDRTPGNRDLDSVSIDEIFLRSVP